MARVVFTTDRSPSARQLNFMQEKLSEALRQLRLALGSGSIFYGLEVYPATDTAVQVLPGLAFDGEGNPLVVHRPVRVPLPAQIDRPRILALRYRPVPVEQTPEGQVALEDDGVELVWLATPPADDTLVPLATIRPERQGRIVVESEVARRAAAAGHRHSGALVSDGAGRQRYDGDPVGSEPAAPAVSPADLNVALTRLRRELLDRIEGGGHAAAPAESAPPAQPAYGWEPEIELIEGI
ncbi:MAG TPA: hypothetical protein VER55_11235, partial [Ardenticatenaceae bacterium]|nr:hypothetical protein [Ardenticatenaceae bacterium]